MRVGPFSWKQSLPKWPNSEYYCIINQAFNSGVTADDDATSHTLQNLHWKVFCLSFRLNGIFGPQTTMASARNGCQLLQTSLLYLQGCHPTLDPLLFSCQSHLVSFSVSKHAQPTGLWTDSILLEMPSSIHPTDLPISLGHSSCFSVKLVASLDISVLLLSPDLVYILCWQSIWL